METLAQMLEDYRNGERGLPSYEELFAVSENITSKMSTLWKNVYEQNKLIKNALYEIRQAHCLGQMRRIGNIIDDVIGELEAASC